MKKHAGAIVSMFLLFAPAVSAATPSPTPPNTAIKLSPMNAVTAGEFALACRDGQEGQDECDDVVGTALLLGLGSSTVSGICLPGTAYSDGVGPWLRAHPETSKMLANDGIMLAIRALYPCGAHDPR